MNKPRKLSGMAGLNNEAWRREWSDGWVEEGAIRAKGGEEVAHERLEEGKESPE